VVRMRYDERMDLRGKTALVTGAAKRVGREITLGLAGKGVHVLLHYGTSRADAEKTAEDVKSLGVSCELFQANLEKTSQILSMIQNIFKKFPSVDILVNSASIFYKTPLEKADESDWEKLLSTNLKAPFTLSRTIGNRMAAGTCGKIINIADWSGFRPYKDYAPYCASKAGLITLTKSLARELAPKVQANAVAPGPVLLPADFPENEKEELLKKIPLGRLGTPRDVANAVLFLVENDFINGTVLVVDGGRSLV